MSPLRNRTIWITLLVIIVTALGQEKSDLSTASDFVARDLKGKRIQLKKLLAKGPVLLDFWALWCVPCLKKLPQIQKLHRQYESRGLSVVAVNEDSPSDQSKVKPFVKQRRYDFKVIVDEDNDIRNQYRIVSLPTTILLDRKGNVVYSHTGYKRGDEERLAEEIERLFPDNANRENK